MTVAIHFHDTYTGPRWRYGLMHRPISVHVLGRGSSADIPQPILFSHRPSRDPRFPHGEADWPCELAVDVSEDHGLVLVSEPSLEYPGERAAD
jgi:hypothetical protein